MNALALVLAPAVLWGQAAQPPDPSTASAVRLSRFVVTTIYDVRVPAREAGMLTQLEGQKGQEVRVDDMLGRIDDSDALVRKIIAENELQVADTQAASDANLKAAEATVGVAQAEYEQSRRIRQRVDDAISEFELRRSKLQHERSIHQAANATVEHEVNQYTRGMRLAQLEAVNNELQRRMILAPLNGVIVDRFHHVGEWAQAGEPIFRIVHMDRLRVEGMLSADRFMPEEVQGSPVKIHVSTPRGIEEFDATIDFVSPVVDPSGEFLIHAEFDNPRKPNGQWSVRPGLSAEVTIFLSPQSRRSERP
jgi:RND family efflux transporter MFP subunit